MTMAAEASKVKWQDDPRRELLKKDIISGLIAADMKPAQAQKVRNPEYTTMDKKLFSSRLKSMRESIAKEASTDGKKKTEPKWDKKNETRKMMKDDIVKGVIPETMGAELAWKLRKEYEATDFALFKSRLNGMRKMVKEAKERAAQDEADLKKDREIHPRPALNARGEVQWIESESKYYLEIDIENGLHKTLEPKDLYLTRECYKRECPDLAVFRGHIYQQIKTNKWRKQWVEGNDGVKEYAIVPNPHK